MRKIPAFETCLAELIGMPSVSSIDPAHDQGNQAVVERLADYFTGLGLLTEIRPIPGKPDKFNLLATLGGAGEPAALVLAGHTDTVPFDARGWHTDPFKLTKKAGRYYGLGVADMKGFFPIVLEALARLAGARLKRPLAVVATADEESSMAGARALLAEGGPLGRYCVIGEPTGLVPCHMHKGIIVETVRLTGQSGHSSDPALGQNALEGMHAVINALLAWRAELQRQYHNHDFKPPAPTMNLGRIRGGDSANRICAECELSLDLRILPGMSVAECRQRLHDTVRGAVAGRNLGLEFNSAFDGTPPMRTAGDSEIVRITEKLSGHTARAVAYGTEGPFFNELGMETVILGPGDIEVAHRPNEYLPIDRIAPMIDIVTRLTRHFCGAG